MQNQFLGATKVLSQYPKYEEASKKLMDKGKNVLDVFRTSISAPTKFDVMVHADCWNNNILFR